MMPQNIHQIEALIGNAETVVNQLRVLVAQTTGDAKEWLEQRMRVTDRGVTDVRRELTQLVNRLQSVTIGEALKNAAASERTNAHAAKGSAGRERPYRNPRTA